MLPHLASSSPPLRWKGKQHDGDERPDQRLCFHPFLTRRERTDRAQVMILVFPGRHTSGEEGMGFRCTRA